MTSLWPCLNWCTAVCKGRPGILDQIACAGKLWKPGHKSGFNWDSPELLNCRWRWQNFCGSESFKGEIQYRGPGATVVAISQVRWRWFGKQVQTLMGLNECFWKPQLVFPSHYIYNPESVYTKHWAQSRSQRPNIKTDYKQKLKKKKKKIKSKCQKPESPA